MTLPKQIMLIAAALALYTCALAQTPFESARILIRAEDENQRIPVLSLLFPDMTAAQAYAIQTAYAQEILGGKSPAGFKAGLTTKVAQQRFGLDQPVAGVLFSKGLLPGGAVIQQADFFHPMLETEIGFVMGNAISEKVTDLAGLKRAVESVVPVIEIPDLGFEPLDQSGTARLKGVDIIAANVSARMVITGQPVSVGALDLNRIEVSLALNGSPVNQGRGSDAMGGQWQALMWLVNTMVEQGWAIEPGQVLITGALGKMVPAKPGAYAADFGPLGRLYFQIN